MSKPPKSSASWNISPDDNGERHVMALQGDWKNARPKKEFTLPDGVRHLRVDVSAVSAWGGFLPAFLHHVRHICQEANVTLDEDALPERVQAMLRLAASASLAPVPPVHETSFLERFQENITRLCDGFLVWMEFLGEVIIAFRRLFTGRARMEWRSVWTEIVKAGPDAFGIVSLVGFLMGLILAFLGAIPLRLFSAESYVSVLIGIGMLRMMGAVMTGIVMAGRTGASYAAELGTMQVNEEVDALESMGISPYEYLVLPRCIALTCMMPLLCLYGDLAGILGGMVVGYFYLDVTLLTFWQQLVSMTGINSLFVGLFSSIVFGVLISISGCLRGLQCGRSSESVGQATTSSMVTSIVALVFSTSIITVLTVFLKI